MLYGFFCLLGMEMRISFSSDKSYRAKVPQFTNMEKLQQTGDYNSLKVYNKGKQRIFQLREDNT